MTHILNGVHCALITAPVFLSSSSVWVKIATKSLNCSSRPALWSVHRFIGHYKNVAVIGDMEFKHFHTADQKKRIHLSTKMRKYGMEIAKK